MSSTGLIFCAACQRRNEADAENCVFCGAPLMQPIRDFETTKEIGTTAHLLLGERRSPCDRHMSKVPQDALALFVMDEETPIIVSDFETLDLGRMSTSTETPHVDFASYGALGQGVSRLHARISFENGFYDIKDMDSSNGTWLNQQRLTPGKTYVLHSGDSILLGRLRMIACFHEGLTTKAVSIQLKNIDSSKAAQAQLLTPYFLEGPVSQYLKAIIELYQINLACRDLQNEEIYIRSINWAEHSSLLYVELDGAGEAVELIRKWIMPWRQEHLDESSSEEWATGSRFHVELATLAEKILLDISPEMDVRTRITFSERLEPPLLILATSELELSDVI